MTLPEFLLARIADDLAPVRGITSGEDPDFFWGPDRIRAECEAKRRIVELHEEEATDVGPGCYVCSETNYVDGGRYSTGWPCDTLLALALPYADHERFQEEWRPTSQTQSP